MITDWSWRIRGRQLTLFGVDEDGHLWSFDHQGDATPVDIDAEEEPEPTLYLPGAGVLNALVVETLRGPAGPTGPMGIMGMKGDPGVCDYGKGPAPR